MTLALFDEGGVEVVLPDTVFAKGEVLVQPKNKSVVLEETPDDVVGRLFALAGKAVPLAFSLSNAQGVSVLIQNGVPAGQVVPNVSAHIIPRSENDGLGLTWNPRPSTEEHLAEAQKKIMNTLSGLSKTAGEQREQKEQEPTPTKTVEEKIVVDAKEGKKEVKKEEKKSDAPKPATTDYRILHLRKIP